MIQKLAALRDDNARLGKESSTLRQAQAMLTGLAAAVSRGDEESVDVPKELRRIAHSLGDSAETLGAMAAKNATSHSGDSLIGVRDAVCTLKREIQEKRRETEEDERFCPTGLRSQLREMDTLLERLCEVSGQAAQAEYYKMTSGHYPGFQKMLLRSVPRVD